MATAVFGFLCRDIILTAHDNQKKQTIGGKGYYAGRCLATLGEETHVFAALDRNSSDILEEMSGQELHLNLQLHSFPTLRIPHFTNTYRDASLNQRISRATYANFSYCIERIEPAAKEALRRCQNVYLGPSCRQEISLSFLEDLRALLPQARIAADLEYFVKRYSPAGVSCYEPRDQVLALLSRIDIVQIAEEDVLITRQKNEQDALRVLAAAGPDEVILTKGKKGAVLYTAANQQYYHLPAVPPKRLVDTTGAGDTFLAAYLFARQRTAPEQAGKFAARIASRKIQYHGPLISPLKN